MTVGDISINDSGISGLSSPPIYNQIANFSKQYAITQPNVIITNARLSGQASDQFSVSPTIYSESSNILCNTVAANSTSVAEYFEDEIYRLNIREHNSILSDYKNIYSSQDSLLGTNNAQVYGGILIYPHQNFMSGILPSQTNADYSQCVGTSRRFDNSSSGWFVYQRAFYNNQPKTKATFDFGLTHEDLDTYLNNGDMYIFIKLPTQTGWLSFNKRYDLGEFESLDDNGCRYDGGQYWQAVFGNKSTAHSCYTIVVEIWIRSTSPQLSQCVITDWNAVEIHPCYQVT
jgi:hypothetical protein